VGELRDSDRPERFGDLGHFDSGRLDFGDRSSRLDSGHRSGRRLGRFGEECARTRLLRGHRLRLHLWLGLHLGLRLGLGLGHEQRGLIRGRVHDRRSGLLALGERHLDAGALTHLAVPDLAAVPREQRQQQHSEHTHAG